MISLENVSNPGRFADIVASHLAIKIEDKQRILETLEFKDRLELLFQIISQEIEILEIEKKINYRVKTNRKTKKVLPERADEGNSKGAGPAR